MTRLHAVLLAVVLFLTQAVSAQSTTTPPSADEVVSSACKVAAATHRSVFIIFHASWCGWCHRMDSLMVTPACKSLFEDHYVIRHLVIMESKDKKALENPGAQELYTKYAGPQGQGIPFWLIIDAKGNVVADSRVKADGAAPGSAGNNTGCPAEPDEVVYFLKVLHATSSLSDDQLHTISTIFTIHRS